MRSSARAAAKANLALLRSAPSTRGPERGLDTTSGAVLSAAQAFAPLPLQSEEGAALVTNMPIRNSQNVQVRARADAEETTTESDCHANEIP